MIDNWIDKNSEKLFDNALKLDVIASVPDNWVNQLKTYFNIKLSEEEVSKLYFFNLAFLIPHFISRIEDLFPEDLLKDVEEKLLKDIETLQVFKDDIDENERKEKVSLFINSLIKVIEIERKESAKNSQTLVSYYSDNLLRNFKNIPEKIIDDYIKNIVINKFEEENFRDFFADSKIKNKY